MLDLSRYGNSSEAQNNMPAGEEDPDLSSMLRAGVDIDDDGDFDPTNLLSQPINFNESIDELDINISDDSGHSYNDHMDNVGNRATSDGERDSADYNEVNEHREGYFRTPTPDSQRLGNRRQRPDRYDDEQNDGRHSPRRHSPQDYNPPPSNISPKPRQSGRNSERIAQVQQRIRQVQQQIHENMDDDRSRNTQHSYRQEPSYPGQEDAERTYPNNYPEEHSYYDRHPRERYSPRDSPHHQRPRSYNGMPSSRNDAYEQPRRRSHQKPLQQQHRGSPVMSGPQNGSRYSPGDRRPPSGYRGYHDGPQHVLGGMSQSLNESNNNHSMMRPPPHGRVMSQSYNSAMKSSNNGVMPRRGIQSMSESLNGLTNRPRMDPRNMGMNRSRNGMDHSNNRGIQSMSASLNGMQNMNHSTNGNPNGMMPRQKGIQSMSASLNGMRQMNESMNGMQGAYGGPASMNRSMNGSTNGMPNMHSSHNGGNFRHPMSASRNGHPLQGMSQSLNGTAPYRGHHPSIRNMPMDRSRNNMGMMNRSMNGSMNASNNGARSMLNNSRVPTAPLLNQVSNLANLPNRGATMEGAGSSDTTKLSRKLMEAMKRTASSRKLIRDLNIAAMLRGDMKSSLSKEKTVVKAKRKASRQSYTKSQSEAAASREFAKAQKEKEQEKEIQPQPQQVSV